MSVPHGEVKGASEGCDGIPVTLNWYSSSGLVVNQLVFCLASLSQSKNWFFADAATDFFLHKKPGKVKMVVVVALERIWKDLS